MADTTISESNGKTRKLVASRKDVLVSELISVPFLRALGTATLAIDAVRDTRTFTVGTGEGVLFTVGDIIEIPNEARFIQALVLGILGDVIEIDRPINHVYVTGTTVYISDHSLRVDGSVTPVVLSVLPGPGQAGVFTRLMVFMEGSVDMDSGTFGPLPVLTNGVVIRKKLQDGDYVNLHNFKSNGELMSIAFDSEFIPNNGGGTRMFNSRLTWEKMGASIGLEGDKGEELQVVIQDDLTGAAFLSFELHLQGRDAKIATL
jgi:hypothetical protein